MFYTELCDIIFIHKPFHCFKNTSSKWREWFCTYIIPQWEWNWTYSKKQSDSWTNDSYEPVLFSESKPYSKSKRDFRKKDPASQKESFVQETLCFWFTKEKLKWWLNFFIKIFSNKCNILLHVYLFFYIYIFKGLIKANI